MHTVQLKIDNSIYDNVMFLLKNLQLQGLEIKEEKNDIKDIKDNFIIDFSTYKIDSFKDIKDPVKWQKDIRNEWQ
ncbi:MAG TPA: hypothetical protein EYG83_02730 [Sulfurospirillum arcachonense]|nr:hypothetical protein [Sulfurospirillum arcachonense]